MTYLCVFTSTDLFEEQHELNDQRREAIDTRYEVPKTDQKLRLRSSIKQQSNSIKPPRYLKGHFPSLPIPNHSVNDQPDPRERLRTDLPSPILYLIEDPPGLAIAEELKLIGERILINNEMLNICLAGTEQLRALVQAF